MKASTDGSTSSPSNCRRPSARRGDEGIDGVIRQDALGLDRIYVQAKGYAEARKDGEEFDDPSTALKYAMRKPNERVPSRGDES